jgi:exodeoxyribonuclease V alpha subunit
VTHLRALVDEDVLAPIDAELGVLLERKAANVLPIPGESQTLGLAAALLSAERSRGGSCLRIDALAGRDPGGSVPGLAIPDAGALRDLLGRSGLCGDGALPTPLVLDGDRLYLYRYHAAERRLAAAVRGRVGDGAADRPAVDAETLSLYRACFDVGPGRPVDWQAVAAAAAMRGRFTVITGGPGTGKTHTVARVLALLLSRDPSLRIAVAAPTGKAAARLAESLRAGAAKLPVSDEVRAALPRDGHTLHRLLGYKPWCDSFAAGPDQPLAEDVVVVDEASMVDLILMDALFAAVRPETRLILLGDEDQLASVDTGYVLGDICRAANDAGAAHTPALGEWYARLASTPLPEVAEAPPLRDCVVRLQRSWRFDKQPGIAALAAAVRGGGVEEVLATLDAPGLEDIGIRNMVSRADELLQPVLPQLDRYLAARTPEEALERLAGFRVLCALRDGPCGVTGLNDAIERWLRQRGSISLAAWYDRRPVLVTANDPATGLYNGDVGVTWVEDGRTAVWFPMRAGVQRFSTSRIPAHATAWAMTVHKAQGSEFDRVILVLPRTDNRVVTRELLYTGVTRARRSVTIYGSRDVLGAAVQRRTERESGLTSLLV